MRCEPRIQARPCRKESGIASFFLTDCADALDHQVRYVSSWVKVAVALALGLGTMVGWKRIVVTVGEKIGKSKLNYAQGASAQLVAAITILLISVFGL